MCEPTSKNKLFDILDIIEHACEWLPADARYRDLLEYLRSSGIKEDDEAISIKKIAEGASISYTKAIKYISEIYRDLGFQELENPLQHKFVEHHFHLQNRDRYGYFKVQSLAKTPRIGEEIDVSFMHSQLGAITFYVQGIVHEILEDRQIIHLHCKKGYYNRYWEFRLDEAKEKEEIDLRDLFNLPKHELKERLGIVKRMRW